MTLKKSFRNPPAHLSWLWALLPLLLAAALTIPLLDDSAYIGDEPASLIAAGMLSSGPYSFADVRNYIANTDPHQALGWPLLLSVWGQAVGWSEVAVRAFPLFSGCLALAWVYRTGRDLFAPHAGLFAALLLSASVFFLAYMIHARSFTLVSLFTTLCIWSYWRIVLHPRPPGRGAQAGLLLGSVGLLWSHYFCALFLPALGLFHLLFVPRNRRWWQPVFLLALAALLTIPQLPGFLHGLDKTAADDALHMRAITALELLARLLHHLTNSLFHPVASSSVFLAILLLAALVIAAGILMRARHKAGASWLIVCVYAMLLAIVLVINQAFKVVDSGRIRYLMPLWPLTALIVGTGLWSYAGSHRRLTTGLLALWLIVGSYQVLVTDFRNEFGAFIHGNFSRIYPTIREYIPATDLLVMDNFAANQDPFRFYTRRSGLPWEIVRRYREDPYEMVRPVHADYPYLWLLYLSKNQVVGFADLPQELGRVFCERVLDEWGFTLERYALHSVENCPDRPVRLEFDSGIQLTAPEITVQDDLLRLDAHFRSADEQLLARYSLAVHVIDQPGQRVAQGDTGVGPGAIVPLRSEIDISALPPGDYELRVALYDWQTGGRLTAHDPETDEVSDMHTLQRFRIG